MLKIKFLRSYTKVFKNGKPGVVFVYTVSGSKEQVDAFKADQKANGANTVEDESGNAIWFTTRSAGDAGSLIKTTKGTYVADMSAYNAADSLAKQFGGNLGQEIARHAAAQLMGGNVSAPTPVAAPAVSADLNK